MLKWRIKFFALALISVFAVFCFTGCNGSKDVYGAASDFIKVSHPDKPNVNAFSQEDSDEDVNSVSGANGSKTSSDSDGTSSNGIKVSSDTGADSNLSSKSETGTASSSETVSSDATSANNSSSAVSSVGGTNTPELDESAYDTDKADYGPVVTF